MNDGLRDMLDKMLRHHIVGAKHIPENLMIKSKLKHLDSRLKKEFYTEYELLLKQNYFIRLKKRTGKGSDWHISLNPEMMEEINNMLEEQDETL